jgi:hypothetical protein
VHGDQIAGRTGAFDDYLDHARCATRAVRAWVTAECGACGIWPAVTATTRFRESDGRTGRRPLQKFSQLGLSAR